MKRKPRPAHYSREWFEQWVTDHPDWQRCITQQSESALHFAIMKATAKKEAASAETVSLRKIALRLQKLSKLWQEANFQAWQAKEALVLLLRSQGRHEEADAVLGLSRESPTVETVSQGGAA